MKKTLLPLYAVLSMLSFSFSFGQHTHAKVYWVGHSLMDHKNWNDPNAKNLIELMEIMAQASGKTYGYHRHTTPGAPIGWNWGVPNSWHDMETKIQPLINPNHSEYGTFNTIVVTEGVNIESSYDAWASGFYARKFYAAAKAANPNTRLFLYESWHHLHAGDFKSYYGPAETFNWKQYMLKVRPIWEKIANEAADPAVLNASPDPWNNRGNYVYQGTGTDPGNSNAIFDIKIIPTGQVLVKVLDRLAENRSTDNWTYTQAAKNQKLSDLDFFVNPYLNFPTDLTTTVHGGDLDDIHGSDVLIYLNTLVHYAVIYRENPANLPTFGSVPQNIASIFKEVVWDVVTHDPRTGVTVVTSEKEEKLDLNWQVHPNPASTEIQVTLNTEGGLLSVHNNLGNKVLELSPESKVFKVDIRNLKEGIYSLVYTDLNNIISIQKIVKQ